MKSSDIIQLAERLFLLVEPGDRPMINNIIGRSYYSCYHKLQEVVKNDLKWSESREIEGGSHEKMISRLDNHDLVDSDKIKLIAKIKTDIALLKKKRVNADYYLHVSLTKLDANYCIATAKKIHEMLSDLK